MLFEAFPFSAGKRSALMHHRSSGYCRFTARVLAPVGVYAVSVHPHSIDPIRPTRQRTATSPQSGLYVMPSLCSLLLAPGQPASGSELSLVFLVDLSSFETPGRSAAARPQSWPQTLAFDPSGGSRHFQHPHTPILVGEPISGRHCRSLLFRPCRLARPPVGADRDFHSADEDFYFRASDGLVTRSAAGYNCRSNWASFPGRSSTCWNTN